VTNERLRRALDRACLTIEDLARVAEVDPKTVQRWLAGRVPHPRHRWRLAEELNEHEEFLWPEARRRQRHAETAAAELVAAYPYRVDVEPGRWWDLITSAEHQIDLLGYTLYFLPHQHPQFVEVLHEKCSSGTRARVAVADPWSDNVRRRDEEEHEAITLVARIQSSLQAFRPLLDCPGAALHFQDAALYNSIFRFDDQMFVTPHLYGIPGRQAPLLHLRRLTPNGLFSRFAAHFEAIWAASTPIGQDRMREPAPAGGT
jgi:transcriptional regulator with XRE-family HTH domain